MSVPAPSQFSPEKLPGTGGRESGLFPVSLHHTDGDYVDRMVWKPEQGLYYS